MGCGHIIFFFFFKKNCVEFTREKSEVSTRHQFFKKNKMNKAFGMDTARSGQIWGPEIPDLARFPDVKSGSQIWLHLGCQIWQIWPYLAVSVFWGVLCVRKNPVLSLFL